MWTNRWDEIERVVLIVDGEKKVDLMNKDEIDVRVVLEKEHTPRVSKEHRYEGE